MQDSRLRILAITWLVAAGLPAAGSQDQTLTAVAGSQVNAVALVSGGQKLHWKDGTLRLRFSRIVHSKGGEGSVDPAESAASVHAALAEAARAWTAGPWSAASVEIDFTDEQAADPTLNTITFTDPRPFDDGLCDKRTAAACTLLSFFVDSGEIQGASIAFNPYLRFSSIGLAGTLDIGAVMLHEVGHAFGLDHSALLNSVMSPFVETITSSAAPPFVLHELTPDDLLSLADLYPAEGAAGALGRVEGTARLAGGAIAGGHVIAVRGDGVPARDTLTDAEGNYAMSLAPGEYTLVLEPLDGPITLGRFTQPSGNFTAAFPTLFWTWDGGDPLRADSIVVEPGGTAGALDFACPDNVEVPNVRRIAMVKEDSASYVFQISVARGADYLLSLSRLPWRGTQEVRFSGASIQPRGPAVPGPDPDLVDQAVTIPPDAPTGAFNVYYYDGTGSSILAGAVRVTMNPVITDVRGAEDSDASGLFRPGQEILIEGNDLAASTEQTDGSTQAAGISVRIAGRFAPLLSVAPSEIRARIPEEISAAEADVTVIAGPDVMSAAVPLRVQID